MTKQKIKFYGFLLILPVMALILGGCGKSLSQIAGEKATEALIENQTGGAAKVDINSGNVKVNTAEGSFESGANVKLPADFPKDVYVIDGNIIAAISNQENKGFSISIESDKSPEEVSVIYQDKLKNDGWKITGTMSFEGSSSVIAEKDTRTVSVIIAKNDNKTTVTVSIGTK